MSEDASRVKLGQFFLNFGESSFKVVSNGKLIKEARATTQEGGIRAVNSTTITILLF